MGSRLKIRNQTAAPRLAIVVNTFNQPDYLRRVLLALEPQLVEQDEILIADDGSGDETRHVIESWQKRQRIRVHHVWQPHEGFRRSRILNAAIARSRNDYLIFLDGDSVPHPRFAADHRALARNGCYIQGHRVCFEEDFSRGFGSDGRMRGRFGAMMNHQIASGGKYLFRWPFPVLKSRTDLRGVRGCNLAIWRADLVRVNGYNEEFEGWGREDSELALRLINSGVQWLDVRGWAICYHLWHPPADRSKLDQNIHLLDVACAEKRMRCDKGLQTHFNAAEPTGP